MKRQSKAILWPLAVLLCCILGCRSTQTPATPETNARIVVTHAPDRTYLITVDDKIVKGTWILGCREDNAIRWSLSNFETQVSSAQLTSSQYAALLKWAKRSVNVILSSKDSYGKTHRYSPSFSFGFAGRQAQIVYENDALPHDLRKVISEFENIIQKAILSPAPLAREPVPTLW